MVWSRELSHGFESDKIAAFTVPYLQGAALDLGCGMRKVWPAVIGVDNGHTFTGATQAGVFSSIEKLTMFADASVDAVFSSHALEDFPREKVPEVLAEWTRVLKVGGHMVLYVPSANLYPKCGEPHANPQHKWDIYPGDLEAMLREVPGCGWTLIESEERNGTNEYSLFVVARKEESGWTEKVWQRNPEGKKRALVIRYGGIGDMIMAASVLPGLQKQGYHVTMNCETKSADVVRHDPHIDEWIVQATNFVPNEQLGPYWASLAERYDKIVNLCESVESALLFRNDRLQTEYPDGARRKIAGGVNYVERTHDIADVPHDYAPRFYATDFEKSWAQAEKAKMNGPVVVWALNGSSPHKVWPWVHVVAAWLTQKTPVHLVLNADGGIGKVLQDAILEAMRANDDDLSRVHALAGKWTVRQSMAFAQVADCVIGPETGLLNGICMESVPKVIYLSHSSPTNLTRDWVNTTVLLPDVSKAPCWPCHKLLPTWQGCFQSEETRAALCASSISPERVFEAIALAVGARKAA